MPKHVEKPSKNRIGYFQPFFDAFSTTFEMVLQDFSATNTPMTPNINQSKKPTKYKAQQHKNTPPLSQNPIFFNKKSYYYCTNLTIVVSCSSWVRVRKQKLFTSYKEKQQNSKIPQAIISNNSRSHYPISFFLAEKIQTIQQLTKKAKQWIQGATNKHHYTY